MSSGTSDSPEGGSDPTSLSGQRSELWDSQVGVWSVAVAAAVGAGFSGARPTGLHPLDIAYTALLALLVTLAASKSLRAVLVWLGFIGVLMSRSWLLIPAVVALLGAFGSAVPLRRSRLLGALVGGLAIQVVLRWPAAVFHGFPTLVAVVALAPLVFSALRQSSPRFRHRAYFAGGALVLIAAVLSVPAAAAGLLSRHAINRGVAEVRSALSLASQGQRRQAVQRLGQARTDLASAENKVGSWWTAGARLVPVVAQQRQAMAKATQAATGLATTAQHQASAIDLGALKFRGGRINLTALGKLEAPLKTIDASLASAGSTVRRVQSPWLVSPIQRDLARLDRDIDHARSSDLLATQGVQFASTVLSTRSPAHYFIAFENPAESRGLGGLIGAYGELTIDNGRLSFTRTGHTTDLNAVRAGHKKITGQPGYMARYGQFKPQDFFQDLTYSPDFPTDADVIGQMYPQSGGDHVAGVIAIDPEAMPGILSLTGPITVPGAPETLTSSNITAFLLKGQYAIHFQGNEQATRHDFLSEVLGVAFKRLVQASGTSPLSLARTLSPYVRQGHLLMWSFDSSTHAFLRQTGLAGSFPATGGGDLLSVVTQNAANNKMDAYLHRTITDHVIYDPSTGQESAKVSINLCSQAPPGLGSYVGGSFQGSGLAPETNRTWLSLYTPLDLGSASLGGKSIRMPGQTELGVDVYSAFVTIPRDTCTTLTASLSGRLAPGRSYHLTLHQQPMANPDRDTITVRSTSGRALRGGGTWVPDLNLNQKHTTTFSHG